MRDKDYSTASAYLARLYGEVSEHAVELRSVPNEIGSGRTASLFTRDPTDIELHCTRWDGLGRAVYYGEVTRLTGRATGRREDLAECVSLWTDTDCVKLGLDKAAVASAMQQMHLPPSIIIDSGYGIHGRWLFTEHLDVSIERPGASALEAELVAALRGLAGLVAGDLAVCDLARVMRLPGTHNTKGGDLVPCHVLAASWARYEWRDLQEMLDWHRPVIAMPAVANPVPSANPFSEFASRFATKAPIDVRRRLDEMTYLGAGETAVHATQLQVSASLVRAGVDDDEITALVLDATHRAAGLAGERWNWGREEANLRRMITDWRKKQGTGAAGSTRQPATVVQFRPQQQTEPKECPTEEDEAPQLAGFPLHDLGNALRLITQHKDMLRFVTGIGWHVWDGRRYAIDPVDCAVRRLAHETARTMLVAAFNEPSLSPAQKKRRERLIKFAISAGNAAKTTAMLAQAEPHLAIEADKLNADIWLVNCNNGTLDLRSGELRPHAQADLITKLAPVDYDPLATCPRWERFLVEIFDGDLEMIGFVQRALGYSLTGSNKENVFFILHGTGRNGKSKLLETTTHVLGDYMQSTPGDTWSEKPAGTMTNAIAALPGVRLVTTIETEKGHRLAEGLVKQVTGGDKISTRKLFHEFFEFTPQLKLWIATNNKPKVSGSDGAIWDRMRLLPFNVKFVPQEELIEGQRVRDNDLMDKLLAELPGILAWMVRGCAEWQRVGLKPAVAMTEAAGAYRQGQDNVQGFIDECCDLSRGLTCAVKRLYGTYEMWCAEVDEEALSKRAFGKNLEERGFPAGKSGSIRLRKRIDLKGEWSERADQLGEC